MTNNIVFSGSILFLSLADVIQLLGGNNCTGILTLRSQYSADVGIIYFINGNPVNASCGKLKGLKAVYALFGWTDGKYEFSEEELTGINSVIKQSRMGLVMNAQRMLDDGKIAKVGPSPLTQKDMEKIGPDATKRILCLLLKGPWLIISGHGRIYLQRRRDYCEGGKFTGKWMWVIYEGTVKITRQTSKGAITLARLGEGCFIGTIRASYTCDYSRSATAIAEGKVRLCILDAEPLQREYAALSENFRKILLSLDKRLRMINDNVVAAYIGIIQKDCPRTRFLRTDFKIILISI